MSRPVASTLPGQQTLLGSWRALADVSPGATTVRTDTVAAAVFPAWAPLNNAIALVAPDRVESAAGDAARLFAEAGVESWALWLPSALTDLDAPDGIGAVAGLRRDTTTLVMTTELRGGLPRHPGVVATSIADATRAAGDEQVPEADLEPPDGVPGLSGWAMVDDGRTVAGAWTYVAGDDCGLYTVGTVPARRRQGWARALMTDLMARAVEDGARTASLQSTRMGQALYEALGFRPVGRYEEWVSG